MKSNKKENNLDIYFDKNYGKLNEELENGQCVVFNYRTSLGSIKHMFIKRRIPTIINGKQYYDIITPYGYGGPIIEDIGSEGIKKLEIDFEKKFRSFCENNKIVSEFIRFHPIFYNGRDFSNIYDVSHIKNTVGTNLQKNDVFKEEFSKSCRKNIKKALQNGVSSRVIYNPTDISDFKSFYYSTMNRNDASDFYYFKNNYFDSCLALFPRNIVKVEAIFNHQVIAMGFYFIYKDIIHIHLSGTLSEYLYLSPAYILRYAITEWGVKNNYKLIHHGGGRSNDTDDGLYKFKKRFGKTTEFKFHIGKKIWNNDIYTQLCMNLNINDNSNYFPTYRSMSD